MATALSSILYTLEPVALFLATIPLFNYSLRQPPASRWRTLFLHIYLPVQCYRKADRLSRLLPESVWFVALTALCAVVHHTSTLVLECWTLPELRKTCPGRSDSAVVLKAWMNLRRLPLERRPASRPSLVQRASFLGRKMLEMAALSTMCIVLEKLILLCLRPRAEDFAVQHRGFFHWNFDRQALLRISLAFHWAWLTIAISHVVHTIMAIIFVVVFPLDHPDDWPPLFGSPLEAYSLRRFWGKLWHKIAAPSQAVYGRAVFRSLLGFRAGTTAEKSLVALWVFTFSGIVHAFVNSKADPEADPLLDLRFLLLNFLGGFAESIAIGLVPRSIKRCLPELVNWIVGFAWLYLFFYCTVPSYQWPVYYTEAIRRMNAPQTVR